MPREYDNTGKAITAVEAATVKALTAAALLVQGDAVLRSPVDTGNLRSSITYNVKPKEARVGTNVEYAIWPEVGVKSKPNYPKQPYLRPALDNNMAKINTLMAKVYRDAIKGVTR